MVYFSCNLPHNHGEITVTQEINNTFRIDQSVNFTLIQKIYYCAKALFLKLAAALLCFQWRALNDWSRDASEFYRIEQCQAFVDRDFLKHKKILRGSLLYKNEVIKVLSKQRKFIEVIEKIHQTEAKIKAKEKIEPQFLQFANDATKKNKDYVMKLLLEDGLALEFAHHTLQDDAEVVMKAVNQNGGALQYASSRLRKNKDIIKAAIAQNLKAFHYVELWNDREIALLAARHGAFYGTYGEFFGDDKPLMMIAVAASGHKLLYASFTLKADPEVVQAAITQDGIAISFAHIAFKNNPEYVNLAINQNGAALQFVHKQFKANRETVRAAISNNGLALRYAAEALKGDRDLVRIAVLQNPLAFALASPEIKRDLSFVMDLVKEIPYYYFMVHNRFLRENKNFIRATIGQNPLALKEASFLLGNRKLVLAAVKADGLALEFAALSFKKDLEIAREAVNQNRDALEFVDESIKSQVSMSVVQQPAQNLNFAADKFLIAQVNGIVAEYLFHPRLDALKFIKIKREYSSSYGEIDFGKINALFQIYHWFMPETLSKDKLKNLIGHIVNIEYHYLLVHAYRDWETVYNIFDEIMSETDKTPEKDACAAFIKRLGVQKGRAVVIPINRMIEQYCN